MLSVTSYANRTSPVLRGVFVLRNIFGAPPPAPPANVPALDESVATAKKVLRSMSDPDLTSTWRMMQGDRELLALPRIAFLRSIMLNHWYHHRGQLLVYLRWHDVPLPSVYGPTADENPFATTAAGAA